MCILLVLALFFTKHAFIDSTSFNFQCLFNKKLAIVICHKRNINDFIDIAYHGTSVLCREMLP